MSLTHKLIGKSKLTGYSPQFAVKDHEIRFDMSFHLEQEVGLDRISNVLEDVVLKIEINQVWSEMSVIILFFYFSFQKKRKQKEVRNGSNSELFAST
jgi:hypothetical protein